MPIGIANNIPSILSRTPPWPGNKSPVSLTLALRFKYEMNKSPNWHESDTIIVNNNKSDGLLNCSIK